jgi:hypothetical protein
MYVSVKTELWRRNPAVTVPRNVGQTMTNQQRQKILDLLDEGWSPKEIFWATGIKESVIVSIKDDPSPVLLGCKARRCKHCGAQVETVPCFLCYAQKGIEE